MTDYATPAVANYHIAKGIVYFKPTGGTAYRDLGMMKEYTISKSSSQLEHNDTRSGIGVVDQKIPYKLAQTIKISMSEIVPKNIALASLGTATKQGDGSWIVTTFDNTNQTGSLKIVGTNDYGAKITFEAVVTITPDGDVTLLTDNDVYTELTISATVTKDATLGYGKYTFPADA